MEGLLRALDRIIRKLRANDGPLALGAPASEVKAAFPAAADFAGEYLVPLGGSFLDPAGTVHGSIRWSCDDADPTPRVDAIQVVLLTGGVGRRTVRAAVRAAGKATGLLALKANKKAPDTWWDLRPDGVDLWIALGDGIVVLDANARD